MALITHLFRQADAIEMGADKFVVTREPDALENMEMTLDLIIVRITHRFHPNYTYDRILSARLTFLMGFR